MRSFFRWLDRRSFRNLERLGESSERIPVAEIKIKIYATPSPLLRRSSISDGEGDVDGAYGSVNTDEREVTPPGGPSDGAAAATPARGEAMLDGGRWGRVVIGDD